MGRPRWQPSRRTTVLALVAAAVIGAVLVAGLAVLRYGSAPTAGAVPVESRAVAPAYPGKGPAGTGREQGSAPSAGDMAGGSDGGSSGGAAGTSGSPGESAADSGYASPAPGADPAQGVPVGGVQRSLVRTAQLTVEVADPGASARQVRTAAAAVAGTVVEEQAAKDGAWLVVRVPADSLDRLVESIDGTVTARTSQVVDATEQVVDLDARVTSQQASVARVRALLAQAQSISEIVAVESELARREADLDSLTSRLTALRDQVALSTLTVNLQAPGASPLTGAEPAPGFLDGLAAGWAGLRALGTAMGAVLGFVLPFLPVLALLAAIGWAVRRIVRGRRVPAAAGASGRSGPGSEGGS